MTVAEDAVNTALAFGDLRDFHASLTTQLLITAAMVSGALNIQPHEAADEVAVTLEQVVDLRS